MMSISKMAVYGLETPKMLRLRGEIQEREVIILVDSGSTHSFLGEALADKLQGEQKSMQPMQVRIADGGALACIWEFRLQLERTRGGICVDSEGPIPWLL